MQHSGQVSVNLNITRPTKEFFIYFLLDTRELFILQIDEH